ncbi:Rha family transcriptional regulator [Xenorhabdus stockiae]|uniref:Rha family transcriptional regulator n=1 Tax=Xenorhabdus stockiae TaxID=351614 RepID=A0A2D0KB13_9GAMM|nr:BRO family protein [Xenorhabdus stockiae]PHM60659.1 Rha family transcriptional regulator [Xenorhabdus stockiae]
MSNVLVFKEKEVIPFDNGDGRIWFTAETLADLLGYANSNKVLNLYNRHKDEFTESMTTVTKVRMNGINNSLRDVNTRLFSSRGAHLIGMVSRTKVAKALRRWLLDLADKESNTHTPSIGYTIQQMQDIVTKARKASDEDSSDAGRRLRKRQDDLVTLDKAEKLIDDLGQMALGLVGGGKKEIEHRL